MAEGKMREFPAYYKDKDTEFPAYRMFLIGRSVVFVIAAAVLAAVLIPNIGQYTINFLLLGFTLIAFLGQIRIDNTLLRTGQFLVEDGEALYTVIGILNLGFGKKHHNSERRVTVYRYSYIYGVKKITRYPFGVGLRLRVYTATGKELDTGKKILKEPGALKRLLMEKGKKRTVLFRLEHNLTPSEEERLLNYLERLS